MNLVMHYRLNTVYSVPDGKFGELHWMGMWLFLGNKNSVWTFGLLLDVLKHAPFD